MVDVAVEPVVDALDDAVVVDAEVVELGPLVDAPVVVVGAPPAPPPPVSPSSPHAMPTTAASPQASVRFRAIIQLYRSSAWRVREFKVAVCDARARKR